MKKTVVMYRPNTWIDKLPRWLRRISMLIFRYVPEPKYIGRIDLAEPTSKDITVLMRIDENGKWQFEMINERGAE